MYLNEIFMGIIKEQKNNIPKKSKFNFINNKNINKFKLYNINMKA